MITVHHQLANIKARSTSYLGHKATSVLWSSSLDRLGPYRHAVTRIIVPYASTRARGCRLLLVGRQKSKFSLYIWPRISRRRLNFVSSGRTLTICLISAATTDRPPTGLRKISQVSESICFVNVTENKTAWRSGRILMMIFITCSSKPMSNIRSSSSRTT